jgi:glutamine synthetase
MASRKSGKPASAKPAQPAAPKYLDIKRGVENWTQASEWLRVRGIEDIECITPDFAGVARGKMMPSSKFTSNTSLSLPSAVFRHTISGEYPEETGDFRYDPLDGDLKLMPDLSTLSVVPWESDPTAQVICDMVTTKGDPVSYTPRNVLKKVVELYTERGWKPVVAPEIEFYLVAQSDDPDYPLKPPGAARAGRSPAGSPIRSPASTSSTSWSTTSTISPTSRGWRSTR